MSEGVAIMVIIDGRVEWSGTLCEPDWSAQV